MPITTVQVSISTFRITGGPLARGRVTFSLSAADIHAGIVVPADTRVTLDDSGQGVATLFANAAGTRGTTTRVQIYDERGDLQFSGSATIPASNCNLHEVLHLTPPASVDDAQAAATLAQAYASLALGAQSGIDGGAAGTTYLSIQNINCEGA